MIYKLYYVIKVHPSSSSLFLSCTISDHLSAEKPPAMVMIYLHLQGFWHPLHPHLRHLRNKLYRDFARAAPCQLPQLGRVGATGEDGWGWPVASRFTWVAFPLVEAGRQVAMGFDQVKDDRESIGVLQATESNCMLIHSHY